MDPSHFNFSPSIYHQRLAKEIEPELRFRGGDVRAWQAALRERLWERLGPLPQARTPLNPRTLWKRDHPLGSIEKIVFTSEPGVDVPAFVCLPRGARPPYRYFICLQGHSTGMHLSIGMDFKTNQTPMEVKGDRDFALGCMRQGIAALCIEQRAFGERAEQAQPGRHEDRCYDAMMQALLLGRTLMGERIYDVMRGVDYLAERGDADMQNIGLMGNSTGGMVTIYAAALLPDKIRYAMPSSCFCTFQDSLLATHHCGCVYVPGLYPVADLSDIAGLIAPRPLVLVAGLGDPLKREAGIMEGMQQVQRIYAAFDAGDHFHPVLGDQGHRFYADLAWPVMLAEMGEANA